MKNYNSKFKIQNSGFTLIEMVVAVAIFAVVITISLTSFLNVSDIQKKAMAFRTVTDNLNFAIEMMTREIRTGKNYCSSPCVFSSSFNFTNASGDSIVYALDNNTIKKSTDGGANFLSLTSSEVEIEDLAFIYKGEGAGDGLQPMVTIIIRGSAGEKEGLKSELNLQATISQRQLDS